MANQSFVSLRELRNGIYLLALLLACGLVAKIVLYSQPDRRSGRIDFATAEPISLLATVFLSGVYLIWVYEANANTKLFDTSPIGLSPGAAAAHYCLPLVSLYRPYFDMLRLWNASNSADDAKRPLALRRDAGWIVISIWWGLFVLWNAANVTAQLLYLSAMHIGDAVDLVCKTVSVAAALVGIVALAAMCLVVSAITSTQEATWTMMAADDDTEPNITSAKEEISL